MIGPAEVIVILSPFALIAVIVIACVRAGRRRGR
jgi:hypothetical protein